MRILKVRLAKNDRISIEYDAENKHKGRDEFSMTCMDRAISGAIGSRERSLTRTRLNRGLQWLINK